MNILYPSLCDSTDLGSFTRLAVLPPIVDCDHCPPNARGYNCNKCAADQVYFQPLELGDTLYAQVRMPEAHFFAADLGTVSFCDIDGVEQWSFALDFSNLDYYAVYYKENDGYYMNLCIPVQDIFNQIQRECWSMKITIRNGFECEFEPYRLVQCNEDTLLISSSHYTDDCLGYWYDGDLRLSKVDNGEFVPKPFNNQIRIPASVEWIGYSIEKETNDFDTELSVEKKKSYELITNLIPPYVAEMIGNILSGTDVMVDSKPYIIEQGANNENEVGTMWLLRQQLTEKCEKDLIKC